MRTVEEYRGFEIVESDWTTDDPLTGEVRAVYVIPGMKERPNKPFLTSVEEAREYVDLELELRDLGDCEVEEEDDWDEEYEGDPDEEDD